MLCKLNFSRSSTQVQVSVHCAIFLKGSWMNRQLSDLWLSALPWQQEATSCPNKERKAKKWPNIGNLGLSPLPASCHTSPMFPVGLQTCCQPAMQQCLQVIALPHKAPLIFNFAMKARWSHYRWFLTSVSTCCCAHSQWRVKRGVPPLLSSTRKQQEKPCLIVWVSSCKSGKQVAFIGWEPFSMRHFNHPSPHSDIFRFSSSTVTFMKDSCLLSHFLCIPSFCFSLFVLTTFFLCCQAKDENLYTEFEKKSSSQ